MLNKFLSRLKEYNPCNILELGTKGWDGKPPRNYKQQIIEVIPHCNWVGFDIEEGEDVTVAGDIHKATDYFDRHFFNGVVCIAVLEHLAKPWVAAEQLARITRIGGLLFCNTHQTFPYHPYPKDYFRFSTEGLEQIFSPEAKWRVLESGYDAPCKVLPLENMWTHARDWNFVADAWLNVSCIAQRI